MPFSSRIALCVALAIYFCWGMIFILQKPGLHEDEALLVANAVRIDVNLHNGDPAVISLPLMATQYLGAIKDYLAVPFIEIFGVRSSVIRVVSLLLGALGIWGVATLVAGEISPAAGFATALVLAIHPAYLNMTVFDNSGFGAMMAALGILCLALSFYLRSATPRAAFALGAACGFGIWVRANFLWTEIALGVALLVVFRHQARAHLARAKNFIYGALLAGSPFLLYQILSGGSTWKVRQGLHAEGSLGALVSYRSGMLAEVLLSDGEHRDMWGHTSLPAWQLWLFPAAILIACVVCLVAKKAGPAARVAAITFLANALLLFTSRLQVAEHHLVALVPLAVIVAIMAARSLSAQFAMARWAVAALAVIYAGCALDWNIETARGLHRTGGKGDWSDAMISLANYLDHRSPGKVMALDWSINRPMYVLTRGRQTVQGLYWDDGAKPLVSDWKPIIEEGGMFLLTSPQHRHFSAAADGFLKAVEEVQPVTHRESFFERDGTPFAEAIEIEPAAGRKPKRAE